MHVLNDLFQIFYPKICITCEKSLVINETLLCLDCRHDLPIICYTNFQENNIINLFNGRAPIQNAVSFLDYNKRGRARQVIHHLKYKGKQEIGNFIGNWFGSILNESNIFKDIDCIIPVPLHPKKLRKRGYNQLTTFGNSLSQQLNTVFVEDVLICISDTKTQTRKSRFDRYQNTKTKFLLTEYDSLKNKHVLLIDDVITTGATLVSCCKELLKVEGIKISVATIAATQ